MYYHYLPILGKLMCQLKPKEPEERITSIGHSIDIRHVNLLRFEHRKQLQKKILHKSFWSFFGTTRKSVRGKKHRRR